MGKGIALLAIGLTTLGALAVTEATRKLAFAGTPAS